MARLRAFVSREIVLVVACALALASCVAVPPDAAYAGYVDWRTLGLMLSLMLAVAGMSEAGALGFAGERLVSRARSRRAVTGALVGVTFVASMFVTNDISLITFVPFAVVTLRVAGMDDALCRTATLMTLAANLGSMLTPFGNPQNLYLFTASGMDAAAFLRVMLPYSAMSAVLLAVGVAADRRGGLEASAPASTSADVVVSPVSPAPVDRRLFAVYAVLFALSVAAVLNLIDVRAVLALALITTIVVHRRLLLRVDYGLLLTFVALFVFVGNAARMPALHAAVAGLVSDDAMTASVLASQVISNVPAAILLSGFTDDWNALIVGTNIGGLGTLIASMASLITFKAVSVRRPSERGRFLIVFTVWNAGFLAVLVALAKALGY